MYKYAIRLSIMLVAVTIASLSMAAVPRLVSYQGTITGAGGPLDGSYNLNFSVYADSTGGTALWTETHAGVSVTFGIFNVILGRFTPLSDDLFSAIPRWVGVAVGGDPEMAPRMRITSVPWAMRAALAESCLVSAPDADWAYSGANIFRMTGYVGIGTSTPAYKLDARDGSADTYLHVSGQDDGRSGLMLTKGAAYLYYDEAAPEVRLWNAVTGGNAGDIAFGTSNLERMRIKSGGQVGIGVAAPTDLLEVGGTMKATGFKMPTGAASGYVLTSNASGVGTWQAPTGSGTDGDWTISGSNQYSAVSGNVGIGTSSPASKLTVLSGGAQSIHGRGTDAATIGVVGYNQSSGNEGRLGASDAGVYGIHASSGNYGYLGGASLGAYGRNGESQNYGQLGATLYGVYGRHNASANTGALGCDSAGVYGISAQPSRPAVYGRAAGAISIGVQGSHTTSQNRGHLGTSLYGAIAYHNASGNYGYIGGDSVGVYGYTATPARAAIYGQGGGLNGYGVKGSHSATQNFGILGFETAGVIGYAYGLIDAGVRGYHSNNSGSLGMPAAGVYGYSQTQKGVAGSTESGYGVYGHASTTSTGFAGFFEGDVHVVGTLSKLTGSFVIDHPLDPMNRTLRHMFVESPENLCLYRGKISLDASGEAVVALPSYFVALTKEDAATVSLTSIGKPFLTGYEWLSDHSAFKVYGEPGRDVSWVAYADRDDPAARKLTRPVEEDKGPNNKLCERGKLMLNP